MGDLKGFLSKQRKKAAYRQVCERVKDYGDVVMPRTDEESKEQASRCMDCATPFCHWACPIGNYIPEWNDYMFRGNWKAAFMLLDDTNNLPEITGRICPALCEFSCVLGVNDEPVTIRENELSAVEHAFKNGLVVPRLPKLRTGKKVAVIGSGPAGLSCAAQLNRAGHTVTVFEKDDKPGGILRYGIPDFKLEKHLIDRRISIWEKEGVRFVNNVDVGADHPAEKFLKEFDAICLAGGCRKPRDLNIEGRNLKGIYFAMDYLTQSNKRVAGCRIPKTQLIDAKNKKVVIIGGGDTGADCVGTAHRQGASCVVQIEVMPRPSECRTQDQQWPKYPLLLKTSSSHEEGGERHWSILTKSFVGENKHIRKILCSKVEFHTAGKNTCPVMKEVPGSEFEIEADMVILAIGFVSPERSALLEGLGVDLDERGNVKTDDAYRVMLKQDAAVKGAASVFAAGDMRRGQSLVVWAISEGRRCAYSIDKYLMGKSSLPCI